MVTVIIMETIVDMLYVTCVVVMLILDIVISTFDGDYDHNCPYDGGNSEYEAFHLYMMMVTMFIVEMRS